MLDKFVKSIYCLECSSPHDGTCAETRKGRRLYLWGISLPFITDAAWTPSTYRRAHAAWAANATSKETDSQPRKASSKKPKHAVLSKQLRNLLTWRAMAGGSDWTSVAANDNFNEDQRPAPTNVDSIHEVRPRVTEIMAQLADVELEERREAKLGGGGDVVMVPVGGDMERGPTKKQGRKPKPDCIVRLGRLQFSNGAIEEPALIRDELDRVVRGSVRIPLGGLVRIGPHRPRDVFRKPKGAANDTAALTASGSLCASAGAFDFVDPIADMQEAEYVRKAVGRETADILDHALVAANFAEIGERLGFEGKTAERRGKAAVLKACKVLDEKLAA